MYELNAKNEWVPVLPHEKSKYHYERAKKLFREGYRSSIELEHVLKEVTRAVAFLPKQIKHYMLFGDVYHKCLDLTSAIYSYRYVLYLKPENFKAKKKLYELLILNGLELMEAADEVTGQDTKMVLYRKANDRFDEARNIESSLTKSDPDIWIQKAICYMNLCNLPEALASVDRFGGQPQKYH